MSQPLSMQTDASLPPAVSTAARPDAHTQRYDRQLRLWASSGQRSLESSRILCVGSSALAGSILKNLILPGIGAFVVVDDAQVNEADLGVNFFLEEQSLGQSRAEETKRCLMELNPGVKGEAMVIPPGELLSSARQALDAATLVLLINQPAALVDAIADAVWDGPNPATAVLVVRAAGLIGEVRLQVRECGIIETHPVNTDDLRLTRPFPALSEYAANYPIDKSDTHAYAHIPFIVLILRALQSWQEQHGKPPASADRKAFAAHLNAARTTEAEGENFDEAYDALGSHVWRAFNAPAVPDEIEAMFKDVACEEVGPNSTNFWLLMHALRSFVRTPRSASPRGGEGQLPLPGSLPDLKAVSATYVKLANLYRAEASADLEALRAHLAATLAKAGVRADAIEPDEVARFAKLAAHVRLVRGRKISEARRQPNVNSISGALSDPVNPVAVQHALAFLASDQFYAQSLRFPGSTRRFSDALIGGGAAFSLGGSSAPTAAVNGAPAGGSSQLSQDGTGYDGNPRRSKRQRSDERDVPGTSALTPTASADGAAAPEESVDFEADQTLLLRLAEQLCTSVGVADEEDVERVKDAARELVRSGNADLPSTAALLGGVAAQEAIKLITRQYVPMNNTCVYDGIQQAIGTFVL